MKNKLCFYCIKIETNKKVKKNMYIESMYRERENKE